MVECQLPKLDVAGSTPVSRSNFSRTYKHKKPEITAITALSQLSY